MNLKKDSVFANRYTLQKRLGKGGFSEVWLANDNLSKIDVALKIGDDSQEFCNELEMVHSISHPNLLIPRHLDIWEEHPYLVMEYCPQGSCYSRIKKMSESQLWDLLSDVASGLKCLHENDVLHQDIKPDNILIDGSGNYVITDFGISTKSRRTVKKDEGVAGSRAYMAAERKTMSVRASDIWAFGATMFEIIDGETPFGDLGGLAQEASDGKIPELNNNAISDELKATVYAMLSLQAWDRPSAQKLLEIAEDHSLIWQIAKKPNRPEMPSKKKEPVPTPVVEPTVVQPSNGVSKGLIAVLIVVVVLCIGAFSVVAYNKAHKMENELNKAHEELVAKIEKQDYNTYSDFCAHYQYLISLRKIEDSKNFHGRKKYSSADRKLKREIARSWEQLSLEEKKNLGLLSEKLK